MANLTRREVNCGAHMYVHVPSCGQVSKLPGWLVAVAKNNKPPHAVSPLLHLCVLCCVVMSKSGCTHGSIPTPHTCVTQGANTHTHTHLVGGNAWQVPV